MEMVEVTKLMEEYFRTVTPEQFEKDLLDAGILQCPDRFEFEVKGDPCVFLSQILFNDRLKVKDVLTFQTIDTKPITINVLNTAYSPYMNESQYVLSGKVA